MRKLLVSVMAAALFSGSVYADSFSLEVTGVSQTTTASVTDVSYPANGWVESVEVILLDAGMTCNVQVVTATNAVGDFAKTLLNVTNVTSSAVYRPRVAIHDVTGVVQPLFTNSAFSRIWLESDVVELRPTQADSTNRDVRVKIILSEE